MCCDISGFTCSVLWDRFILISLLHSFMLKECRRRKVLISVLSLKDTQCLIVSPSPAGFLCCLDCLLTGGLAVLLCAAWWFWYWHSTTWACCAAPWATTSTPHPRHEAASRTRGERCWLRESSAWIQTGKERIDISDLTSAGARLIMMLISGSVSGSIVTKLGSIPLWTQSTSVYDLIWPKSVSVLHSGVGISFIFSWVLMGLVTIIFLAGGNMEKLVCEPFHTKEVFKASR